MNIVMITTGKRPMISSQAFSSLMSNAADWSSHQMTIVIDSDGHADYENLVSRYATTIINTKQQGASRSRNIGAASVPKYLRHEHVMFVDDDVYMCPGWDERLLAAAGALGPRAVISGHSHPYNLSEGRYKFDGVEVERAGVLSTVNMFMEWAVFDDVGWLCEPGGPGGSEDVDWSRRAVGKGYALAVTVPQCVIHTGEHSSNGKPIVGYEEVVKRNRRLVSEYKIDDIIFG